MRRNGWIFLFLFFKIINCKGHDFIFPQKKSKFRFKKTINYFA